MLTKLKNNQTQASLLNLKVALVYDRVNKWGGAESVLLALHRIWPKAPLFTSVANLDTASWAKDFDLRLSFLQKSPLPKTSHEYYPFLMGPAFETFTFDDYDLVISITHEFAKAIITKPKTLHICYCLTPTGYLWSGYEQYFQDKSIFFKNITYPIIKFLRWYDQIVCFRPDRYIAISNVVSDRIKHYYHLPSDVVYPPATLNSHPVDAINKGNYYLIVSRLVPNKHLEIAIFAANKLMLPLKIVGQGRTFRKLQSLAGPTIEFIGYASSEKLASYYQNCLALIVPAEEDFGLVSVEAQSYGKPVIAFGRGGSLETVINGKTGYFFPSPTSESLIDLLKVVDMKKIKPQDCISQAQKFSENQFRHQFLSTLAKIYQSV